VVFSRRLFEIRELQRAAAKGTRAMTTFPKANHKRAELEQDRLRLQTEINQYPAPIPACDVYFNDLLERRSRVCDELARLADAEQAG
jgi:hypothetical protein